MVQRICSLIALSLALAVLGTPATRAVRAAPADAIINVDSTLDAPDDNINDGLCHTDPLGPAHGKCTLRAAVMQANVVNIDVTIIVPAGTYTLTLPPVGADGPETGDLNLTAPLSGDPVISIVGAGADSTIIDGNGTDRVFFIDANRTASISGVTIRDGHVSSFADGGGVYNLGRATLTSVTLSGNSTASRYGGALYNAGTATLNNSTLSGNSGSSSGGGIFNSSSGLATLNNSTLSDNPATYGGGIYSSGTATLNNSTLSGNSATYGGGVYNVASLYLVNSTLSDNIADLEGGGIDNSQGTANVYNTSILFNVTHPEDNTVGGGGGVFNNDNGPATFKLRNTLMAGNTSTGDRIVNDCAGTLDSYGHNLFGTWSPCTVVTHNGTWNPVNSINLIGPLQNNGGPTLTRALLTGSNAIDGVGPDFGCLGPSATLTTDQRGAPRGLDGYCDIGAFEYLPPLFLPLVLR